MKLSRISNKKIVKYLLGYDIRFSPEDYIRQYWTEYSRSKYLVNPDVKWPLSVDVDVWPSWFCYHNIAIDEKVIWANKLIFISQTNFRQKSLHLWENLDDMTTHFLKSRSNQFVKGVVVAISLCQNSEIVLDDYWSTDLYPLTQSLIIHGDWQFLGFDIADRGFTSAVSNCGYLEGEKNKLIDKWGPKLNEHGLLENFSDAINFKISSDERVPEHAPFYIFEISRKPSEIG